MRTGERSAVYFAEDLLGEERKDTPDFLERDRLAEEETFQLERLVGLADPARPQGEAKRFYTSFRKRIVEPLGNRILELESERQLADLDWRFFGNVWDEVASHLGRGQFFANLMGVEQADKLLHERLEFAELTRGYMARFDEPLLNEEAIRALQRKVPVTEAEMKALEARYRSQAFTISKVTSADLIEYIKQDLAAHIAKGGTFTEWQSGINKLLIRRGVGGLDPRYLRTVYRTNVASAYNLGRWEQTQRNAHLVELLEYHAILDEKTRDDHRAMHGVKAPIDAPVWGEWYPPNGYNCRCIVLPITPYVAREYELVASPAMPDKHPDKGFAHHPAQGLPPQYLERAAAYGIQ